MKNKSINKKENGKNNIKIVINSDMKKYYQEEWYKSLPEEAKYLAYLIFKYHNYYKKKDRKHKIFAHVFKISVLLLAMLNTICLGVSFFEDKSFQISIGLILSAIITCLTALSSFFNFEQYWMRNVFIHIELNKIRDNFIFEATAHKLNKRRIKYYLKKLDKIQDKNIVYWKKALHKSKKI